MLGCQKMTMRGVSPAHGHLRSICAAVLLGVAAACGEQHATTELPPLTYAGHPGFDIAAYPGDSTLTRWRSPASPYQWVGYYLTAPCHRDASWMGQYQKVTAMGWGTAVIYVGQQDWSVIPDRIPLSDRLAPSAVLRPSIEPAASAAVACSASLLSVAQGTAEAADAVAKTAGEGVPPGSAIFLDVEYVTTVQPALLQYVSAWIAGVLADGRFRPAIYCAKSNADAIYAAATAAYSAAGGVGTPRFWIASSSGFAITSAPQSVGLAYASVWQGLFDVSESWGGVAARIDVDVASTPSPSAP